MVHLLGLKCIKTRFIRYFLVQMSLYHCGLPVEWQQHFGFSTTSYFGFQQLFWFSTTFSATFLDCHQHLGFSTTSLGFKRLFRVNHATKLSFGLITTLSGIPTTVLD